MKIKVMRRRGIFAIVAVCLVLSAFLVSLFYIQIHGEKARGDAAVTSVEVPIPPVRGVIYDCNGFPLVTNKQINTVVIDYLTFPEGADFDGRNAVLKKLISFFEKHKIEWIDKLPLKVKGDEVFFDEENQAEITYLKSPAFLNLNYYATAQNCFDALIERYHLQDYKPKTARKIASVYYSMRKNGFNSSTPYIFATDVSDEFLSVIMENSTVFRGIEVSVSSERAYSDGKIAPHIIGVVGPLTQEEYDEKKEAGYNMNDVIGKTGIEFAYEELLRGKPGRKLVTIDSEGNKTESVLENPVNGAAVVLTIDKNVQLRAQEALEAHIRMEQLSRSVTCGSVVAMDARNNAIIACASYPTFDLETYNDDFADLSKDAAKPLWNRALRSVYTPGSTIKPCVAMAGLEEGVINKDTIVYCNGIYKHYEDYQPGCTGRHGGQNVVYALYHSCNIFFYETSRLLGIDTMNKYFTMFGFGEKTGVELLESSGQVDSPTFRESIGDMWTPGLTIQAGIGHGDNDFTPIQLCSYVSTIANKGIRYRAHFVKAVMSANYSETLVDNSKGTVLSKANFSNENWDLVHQGMYLVGTRSYADFSGVPCKVAAKTGTTTVEKRVNGYKVDTYNGLIVTFAPFEKPEICCSVVIEGAGSGGSTAPVASAVMQQYFEKNEKTDNYVSENGLDA